MPAASVLGIECLLLPCQGQSVCFDGDGKEIDLEVGPGDRVPEGITCSVCFGDVMVEIESRDVPDMELASGESMVDLPRSSSTNWILISAIVGFAFLTGLGFRMRRVSPSSADIDYVTALIEDVDEKS